MRYSSLLLMVGLLFVPAMIGCSSTPKAGKYTYHVTLDESLRTASGIMPSIELDFIGIRDDEADNERAQWQAVAVDTYFQPGNALRASAPKYTMSFSNENAGSQRLTNDAPIWSTWSGRGATTMVIIASVPMQTPAGGVDPRKLMLTLMNDRWNNGQQIDIVVRPSGVVCESAMKPVKN